MASLDIGVTEPFSDCTEFLDDNRRLQSFTYHNGYLFFRSLLPTNEILELRNEILQVFARHDLLENGRSANDGICRKGAYIDVEYDRNPSIEQKNFYNQILGLRKFNAFFHHSVIVNIIEMILGHPIFVHPRVICHILFPGNLQNTAEPHQDFAPVRGTPNTWTVWTPLGDCSNELGGITVARGSHRRRFLKPDSLSNGELFDKDTIWCWQPFTCGDVLMFHSLTVHQGRDNLTENEIRLSTSGRYQLTRDVVDRYALDPQKRWASWEELYENWPLNDELKYYWGAKLLNTKKYE